MGLNPFRDDPLIILYKVLSYLYPGFVAAVPSSLKRDVNEYGPSNAPLPTFKFPLPSVKFPFHSASAVLTGIFSFSFKFI